MDTLLSLFRALIGVAALLGLCWLLSENRKRIDWRLVIGGLGLQVVLAFLILRVGFVSAGIEGVSSFFNKLIGFSDEGARMIFGSMPLDVPAYGMAFTVLPTIIFFSAFSAVLYHLRILQAIVFAFAWVMSKTMKLSGAECLAAAANVFIGQTEAPLVVKPYLKGMSRSEINCLMTGGMATIAGGVLAIYMGLLGGDDAAARIEFGKHLLTASILSAPAALIAAKIIAPQKESIDSSIEFPNESMSDSLLDAATKGTSDGLKLALNVGAMLIAFTALVALLNYIVANWLGSWSGLNDWVTEFSDGKFARFDFSFVVGLLSVPFAWILGIENEDLLIVGQLLGERMVLNEFFAYLRLAEFSGSGELTSGKSVMIATYALCGFANLTSVGIQIGGISTLEPSQRPNLLKYGLKSMCGGLVACYLTAIIATNVVGLF